ncbi:phage tail tube protein [Metaclostridioides mangenotii]|uniref:Phage portal protein n=1 Tax=Metaclostridioides mangenotii TaxID=1540 RepID=A0ABS4E928_9FIRM|nr:phage tail tube protein [Clostridioides mangenotii]MBP1854439.1 hypothetical protein [Clostridioides mangenotii]
MSSRGRIEARNVMSGTSGELWLDGDKVAEVKKFQAKLELTKEEVVIAGQMGTDTKYMGYKGKGSITLYKVSSRMAKLIGEKLKVGEDPRFTAISKLNDPDAFGSERIAVKNISFDDLTLADWEVGVKGEVEAPFTFTDYDFIDLV